MSGLPIESELYDDEYYVSHRTGKAHLGSEIDAEKMCYRLGPVAEYRPAPTEPKGLGAVVKDVTGCLWVKGSPDIEPSWYGVNGGWQLWKNLSRPLTVLSEGVVTE